MYELSPAAWLYPEKTTYVWTHRKCKPQDTIVFTDDKPCTLIQKWKQEEGKDIWICGGAQLIAQLHAEDLIDRYHITIIPMLLHGGIPLFPTGLHHMPLHLVYTESYCGMVDLVYEKKQ